MTARMRIAVFGIALLIAGAIGSALLMSRGTEAPAAPTPSPAEQATALAPAAEPDAPEPPPSRDSAATVELPVMDEPAARAGRGRVFGKATLPADAPPGLAVAIQLHRVPPAAAIEFTFDDTLHATVNAEVDGGYEFAKLPLEPYVVIATAEGYTHNLSTELTRERPESELNIALVPAGTVAGRVLNENREPVPGARVFVAGWDIAGQKSDAPRGRSLASQQITDAEGAFRFPYLRRSQGNEPGYQFAVKADGFATLVSDYIGAPKEGVEFVLTPGGIVSGLLVRQDSGAPIPDKVVAVESPIAIDNYTARTDTEGFFFLTDLPAGAHVAQLRDPELVITPETDTLQVTAGTQAEDVVLQAASGARIVGRVFDLDSGKGLLGVEVFSQPVGIPYATHTSHRTNADGRFQFAGLRPGQYRISFEQPNGYPNNYEDHRRTVTARLGAETSGIEFGLARGLTVTGKVVDDEGRPLADVSLRADAHNFNESARTGADGTFILAGFHANARVRMDARKANYALHSIEPSAEIRTTDTGVSGITVVMVPEAKISGTVVTPTGQPKAGARVTVRSRTQLSRRLTVETSEADGSITFDRLAPGEYAFSFSGIPITNQSEPRAQRVKIAKGEHLQDVRIVYPDSGGMVLAGRVVDTRGASIPNAMVEASSRGSINQIRTEADGAFRFENLGDGTVRLSATSERHSPTERAEVQAGDENVKIVLNDLATIEGRVVSARTGQPVPSFRIQAAEYGPRISQGMGFEVTNDPAGAFKLTRVKESVNSLDVRAEGYADQTITMPAVTAGQQIKGILIRLEDAVSLQGRVLDTSGAGIPGAHLAVGENPAMNNGTVNETDIRGSSSADGDFTVAGLGAGPAVITATHHGFARKSITINLVAGVPNRVDIVLSAGGEIEGTVTSDGKPIANHEITLHMSNGADYRQTLTDAQGRYQVTGLSEGSYSVYTSLNERNQHLQIGVTDGLIASANFDFRSGTSIVEGTIYTGPNQLLTEPARLFLTVTSPTGVRENKGSQSNSAGQYSFMYVPAGEISLTATLPNEAGQRVVTLTVGENQRIQQDFHFYGGGTARVRITGAKQPEIAVLLISGAVQVTEFSQETMQQLRGKFVAQGNPRNGEAVLSGLEPGDYTALCFSFDEAAVEQQGGDPFATAQWATQTFTADKDKEVIVNVQLNR